MSGRVLARFLAGETSPSMALMALAMATPDAAALGAVLDRAADRTPPDSPAGLRLARLRALHAERPDAHTLVHRILGAVPHSPGAASGAEAVDAIAAGFDAAAAISPEAGVALYALGDPDLLASATAEIAARLRALEVVGPDRRLLEIGCGIGRFARALAGDCAAYAGIDPSAAMIAEALRRSGDLPRASFHRAPGHDLPFTDGAFDTVLAVDSFPYVVQAGGDLPRRTLAEVGRLLRPGGDLVILNYSYRDDLAGDRRDLADLAPACGLRIVRGGPGGFRLWDGSVFHLRRT